jgi:hypothetical protein
MARLKHDLTGNAGVMFVAAELCRRGVVALPTARNTEGIDLIASEPSGGKSVAIQVKTSQRKTKKWLLTQKAESVKSPTIFYVFVNLGLPGECPEYHVVPSRVVAATIKKGHQNWLDTPGKSGRRHQDSKIRVFWDRGSKFRDNWPALGLSLVT